MTPQEKRDWLLFLGGAAFILTVLLAGPLMERTVGWYLNRLMLEVNRP